MSVLSLLLLFCAAAAAGEFRAGAAAVRITPPKGAPMAGYYNNRSAEGVHDDLFAKALVFDNDGLRAAIAVCDLASVPREIVEEARRRIERTAGIPAAAVMIGATHAHTGPVVLAGGRTRYTLEGETLRIAREYAANLPEQIAAAVRQAAAALQPARLSAAVGREDSLTFNRRYHMKDGSVGWNPGKLNPNILRPAGPIDPEVPVLYLDRPDGKPMAAYVNYALHLDTVGGLEYSADYPYTLARQLAAVRGPEMLTVFSIGCAGNLNHLDVKTRDRQKGHEEAARIGTVLAATVLKTMKSLEAVTPGGPLAASEVLRLPVPEVRPGEIEWAKAAAATFGKPSAAPFLDLVRAFRILDVADRGGSPIEAEVQVLALGPDVAIAGLPGEIFTELGMAIKLASPFRYMVVAELTNGAIGYVPNRKAYPEGAYEVVSARCAAGSGEMLVDAATRLLVNLHSEARKAAPK